jgi:hypothetical protein
MRIVQEDTRQRDIIKRTRKQLNDQQEQMNAMALVAHESGCDLYTCPALTGQRKFCFKYEPSKIVSDEYEVKEREDGTKF